MRIFFYYYAYIFAQFKKTLTQKVANQTTGAHQSVIDLKANGSCATLCLELSQSLFIQVSPLFSITQVSLSLPELSKVHGSNLLSLLNLLLVGLDLGLELVNQSLHTLVVLAILISRVSQLFDSALRLAQILLGIREATVFSI